MPKLLSVSGRWLVERAWSLVPSKRLTEKIVCYMIHNASKETLHVSCRGLMKVLATCVLHWTVLNAYRRRWCQRSVAISQIPAADVSGDHRHSALVNGPRSPFSCPQRRRACRHLPHVGTRRQHSLVSSWTETRWQLEGQTDLDEQMTIAWYSLCVCGRLEEIHTRSRLLELFS